MRTHRVAPVALGGVAALLLAHFAGCATGNTEFGDGGQRSIPSGGGGAGGGLGPGGSDEPSPCGVDCSSIETDQCHQGVCNAETLACAIVAVVDGTPCDDDQFCTVDDICTAGECWGGPQNDCGMQADTCYEVVCTEATESCNLQPLPNATPCASADLCEVNAVCTAGDCSGSQKDCLFAPVPDECHVSECNPATGDCEPVVGHEGEPCIDVNDLCTVDKTCAAGVCQGGQAMNCNYLSVGCFNGLCDDQTGDCYQEPIAPGNACAAATDDCNQGLCDVNGDCLPNPINEGQPCDDGFPCTTGTACTVGECTGGTSASTIYFADDFQSNAAGWTLDTEWQIGSAQASSGHTSSCGNADPANDHTPTNDNGIGGVVIGGNASTALHAYYYLTSPPIDTSGAATLVLQFWRWLNSDYTPFMQNSVEVYDGATWQIVWQSSSTGIHDAAWTLLTYDISAYSNAALQVRFGFTIGSSGVYTCSGWNVDDVIIASAACF